MNGETERVGGEAEESWETERLGGGGRGELEV